jgi:hypothetical protein
MKRHKRYFNCKSLKESPPQNILYIFRKSKMSKLFIICCPCSTIQKLKKWLHSLTSKKSIEYQQISSFYFTSTTSSQSNKLKHRLLCTFILHIKTNLINSCKTSKLKGCKEKKSGIKRCTMCILSGPATLNSNWYLKSSLLNYPKTNSIQTKFQVHCKKTTPPKFKRKKVFKRCSIKCMHRSICKGKTRPLTHTQKKSSQTKLKGNIAMARICSSNCARKNTQKTSSN